MKDTRLRTDKPITVKGVTVGNLKAGDTIDKNTPITELLERILVKFNPPTASLSVGSASTVEAGTSLNRSISGAYTKNDGGELTGYALSRNGIEVLLGATLQTYTETAQIGDESIVYSAIFSHAESTSIAAGSVTASASITGKRQAFYGVDGGTLSSDQIRAYAGKTLNPSNGTTFTINIPAGAVSVQFAYPSTLRDVTSVKHLETNFDVKSTFTQTELNVAGANGFEPVSYRVYSYTPAAPFTGANKYTVTI